MKMPKSKQALKSEVKQVNGGMGKKLRGGRISLTQFSAIIQFIPPPSFCQLMPKVCFVKMQQQENRCKFDSSLFKAEDSQPVARALLAEPSSSLLVGIFIKHKNSQVGHGPPDRRRMAVVSFPF